MDRPLFDLLDSCTVHLKVPGGTGTGFFVAPELILTCAHVVKGAEGDATRLTVHYRKEEYEVQEIVESFPDPYTDLALLRIDLREHPCVYLDKYVKPPDKLYAYGYATQSRGGETRTVSQATTVEYEGETRVDDQWLLKFKGGQIIPGYSGSPLLNMRTWGVCGIVKSTRDRATDLGGGGIPTEVVLSQMPELIPLQEAFHRGDARWEEARDQQKIWRLEPIAPGGKLDAILYKEAREVHRPDYLFGRDDLLDEVGALLDGSEQVLLHGLGGSGKTALAATITYQRIRDGKGPVIWLEPGQKDADAMFDALVTCFATEEKTQQINPLTGDKKAVAVKDLLARSQATLLVLDDVRNGPALRQVLKAAPDDVPVLVTSRRRFGLKKILDVGDLEPDNALELLGYHAGEEDFGDDEEAQKLCKDLGYHPYALEIAGNTLNVDALTPGELRAEVADAPHEVSMPEDFAEEGRESVKKLLDSSFNTLDEETQDVFRVFGALFAPSATAALLAYMVREGRTVERRALRKLVRRSLAKRLPGTDYYYVHDLTFSYAQTMFRDGEQDYLATVAAVQRYVSDHAQDFDSLQLDQPNILAAAEAADDETRLSIIRTLTLDGYFNNRGHTLSYLKLLDQVLAYLNTRKDKAELNTNQLEMLHHLLSKRGNASFDRGDYDNALKAYRQALDLADSVERVVILSGVIGKTLSFRGDSDDARSYFDRACELAKEAQDDYLLSFALGQESHAAAQNEEYETARRLAAQQVEINERLLQMHRNPEMTERLAHSLLTLGTAEHRLAEQGLQKALSRFQRVEQIAEEMDDDLFRAIARNSLAEVYHTLGQRDKAGRLLNEARMLHRRRGVIREENYIVEYMREHGYEEVKGEGDSNKA